MGAAKSSAVCKAWGSPFSPAWVYCHPTPQINAQTTLNLSYNLHPRNYQASSWSRSSAKKKKILEITFKTKTPNNAISPIQCLVNLQRAGHINNWPSKYWEQQQYEECYKQHHEQQHEQHQQSTAR